MSKLSDCLGTSIFTCLVTVGLELVLHNSYADINGIDTGLGPAAGAML